MASGWQQTPTSQAMRRALRYLASQPHSEAEVRQRLLQRFPHETVASTLERLREVGLLDDSAFARSWTHSRLAHRPRSASLIARELAGRGVAREIIQEALAGTDDEAAAYQAGQRLLGRLLEADYATFRRRGWQFLQRRGFSSSVIHHTLDRLWEEAMGERSG